MDGGVKDGRDLLHFGTLKFAVSQEWIDEIILFFASWYKFRKVKSYFNTYWEGMVKNGQDLIDHGTIELGISHKWFDELSRLIEWFLYADSDEINNFWFDCQSTLHFWHLNAEEPL